MDTNLSRRDQLCHLITQWNQNRLPLFSLSSPNEDLEFYGVMRFYYKEPGEKVTTKCIRVSSLATTSDVVEALIEKFKPDMRLLNQEISYEILEIHENGEERRLDIDEHPLFVQLSWHKNDREGRFLLRSNDAPQYLPLAALQFDSNGIKRNNKRFSKRDKKELKKASKLSADFLLNSDDIGRRLYEELPHNTFTRTISNPEAVMKKRREQKLENKLKQISCSGSHGGSLKIYGSDLFPNRPYITLLVSEDDTAFRVVANALEKYGLENERVENFVLVEVTFASEDGALSRSFNDLKTAGQHRERCLLDDECPLICLSQNLLHRDIEIIFALRKRPPNFPSQQKSQKASPVRSINSQQHNVMLSDPSNRCGLDPVLIPIENGINTLYSSYICLVESQCPPFVLNRGLNEIGSDFSISGLMLRSQSIQPRHCVLEFSDGIVVLTPLDTNALVEVNGNLINCSVILRDSNIVRLGGIFEFAFHRSMSEYQQSLTNNQQSCQQSDFPANNYSSDITQFDAETNDVISVPRSNTANMHLPGLLDVPDHVSEDRLLQELVDKPLPSNYSFRLSPAFCFYMACRYRLMPPDQFHRSNSLFYKERLRSVPVFINAINNRAYHAVHVNPHNKELSLFWLANMSELLHIIKRDNELSSLIGPNLQSQLMETVEIFFQLHVEVCKVELQNYMLSFLDLTNAGGDDARNIVHLLNDLVLSYRRSRLNPALIIQSFSQLFHFINMYAFNWLIGPAGNMNLTRLFAMRFRARLQAIYLWAEKQGLEFAAECHLDRIAQALRLLITPKSIDQLGNLGSTCYKLNSVQVSFLLEYYLAENGESPVSRDLIENLVHLAQTQSDRTAHEEGQRIQLEETATLGLPFLFPQDGYVIDSQRGIPSDLLQLIGELQRAGICHFIQSNNVNGPWFGNNVNNDNQSRLSMPFVNEPTIDNEYASVQANRFGPSNNLSDMSQLSLENNRSQPQRIFVQIRRPNGVGIGLSIVAAQGVGDRYLGIYVKKVVEGSIAYREGHLETGDQLLSVNNFSLLNVTQEIAAQKIAEAGHFVQIEVAKHAASFNGLDSWLKNTNFVRRSQPQLSAMNHHQVPHQPSVNSLDPNSRHYRSASASELYSQADTASISSNQPQALRPQQRYRPAQKPQIVQQERVPVSTRMSASNLEPPPLYSAINANRSSSAVSFNVIPSYSTSAVPLPFSTQKSQSTSNFPSGRRSAPLFNSQQIDSETEPTNKNIFADFKNGNSNAFSPTTRAAANVPLTNRTQRLLQMDRRVASVNPAVRNEQRLPFLNEINTKFNEINSNRDKQQSASSVSRFHPDVFVNQIDQLEQTANSCDNPQRGALRETSSPDERHKKRVQFAEVSGDDLKENGNTTSTSSNASDSPRSDPSINHQISQQRSTIPQFDNHANDSIRLEAINDEDDEEDNEPRSQILGNHEIYNDPRQRRLNELQKTLKPVPDGSILNFRDKMKLFAQQLGENSPKDKLRTSSAQREIEIETDP